MASFLKEDLARRYNWFRQSKTKILLNIICLAISILIASYFIGCDTDSYHEVFLNNFVNLIRPDWPTATLILVIFICIYFRVPLSSFIDRIIKVGMVSLQEQAVNTLAVKEEIQNVFETEAGKSTAESSGAGLENELKDKKFIFVSQTAEELLDIHNKRFSSYNCEDKYHSVIHYFALNLINNEFKNIHSGIFLSQLILLSQVDSSSIMPYDSIKSYYNKIANTHSEFYKNWNLEDYLQFLFRMDLISRDSKNFALSLTDKGKYFLHWWQENVASLPSKEN